MHFSVHFVHAISPSNKDVGDDVEIAGNAFSDSKKLAKALRDVGVLASGGKVGNFRVEGDKVIVFPSRNGTLGPKPYLTGNWHSIVLTHLGD